MSNALSATGLRTVQIQVRRGGGAQRTLGRGDSIVRGISHADQSTLTAPARPRAGLSIEDPMLARAAHKFFGGCRQALQAAGVEPRPRKWTKPRLIAAIQDRYVRGLTLSHCAEEADVALMSSARRYFGTWNAALQAAGLEVQPRRKWTRDSVLEAIRRWHDRGSPLAAVRQDDRRLHTAARRRFGSWSRAVAAAGLNDHEDVR